MQFKAWILKDPQTPYIENLVTSLALLGTDGTFRKWGSSERKVVAGGAYP
jgi:hypothetical protein